MVVKISSDGGYQLRSAAGASTPRLDRYVVWQAPHVRARCTWAPGPTLFPTSTSLHVHPLPVTKTTRLYVSSPARHLAQSITQPVFTIQSFATIQPLPGALMSVALTATSQPICGDVYLHDPCARLEHNLTATSLQPHFNLTGLQSGGEAPRFHQHQVARYFTPPLFHASALFAHTILTLPIAFAHTPYHHRPRIFAASRHSFAKFYAPSMVALARARHS